MNEQVKRYDAVHIRYEDNNIRYGEGCEVEVVTAADYEREVRIAIAAGQRMQDKCDALQAEADLTAVRCQCCATEYPHDSYDAGFIAGSGMCQVCDAAMPPKDLPAAGSAVEDVSSFRLPDSSDCYGFGYVDGTCIQSLRGARNHLEELLDAIPGEPLMTVSQHQRIVAAISAQQSAHVSVPRELLERVATHLEWDGDESQTVIQYANKCDALAAELHALLNEGEA